MGDRVDVDSMSDAELQAEFKERGLPVMPLTDSTRKFLIERLKQVRITNNPEEARSHLQNAWKAMSVLPDTELDIKRKICIVGALKSCMTLIDQDFVEALVKLRPEVKTDIYPLNEPLWDFVVDYIVDIPTETKQIKSLNVLKVIVQECLNHWNETHNSNKYVYQLFFKEFASKLHDKETFCGPTYFLRVDHVYNYLLRSFKDKLGISAMYSYYWDWQLLLLTRIVIDGRYVCNKEVCIRFGFELGRFVEQLKDINRYYNSFQEKILEKVLKITKVLKKLYSKEPVLADRHVKVLIACGLSRHESLETLVLALAIMPQDLQVSCGVETELLEVIKTIKKQNYSEVNALLNDKFIYTDLKVLKETTICSPREQVTVEKYDQHPPTKDYKNYKENSNFRHIYVANLNVRTLFSESRITELDFALKDIKWDILGLCETRRENENITEYPHFILYHSKRKNGKYGVGFLVKKYLKKDVISFSSYSDRIASLEINFGPKNPWTIIQVYAPIEACEEEELNQFYETLYATMDTLNIKQLIIMGDFNARVGSERKGEETIFGHYSYGKRSNHGQRLVDFALKNKLKIMNSVYKIEESKKWTWESPNGLYHNEIDYILTNEHKYMQSFDIIQTLHFKTDHRMIRCKICL